MVGGAGGGGGMALYEQTQGGQDGAAVTLELVAKHPVAVSIQRRRRRR